MVTKKILLIIVVCFIAISTACNNNTKKDEINTIGIIKFVRHPALDATEKGLIDRLNAIAKEEGFSIKFDQNVADKNFQNALSMAEQLKNRKVKVIVSIATPAAQAVTKINSGIPHVYGAVSDPEGAHIIPSPKTTGIKNVGPSIISTAFSKIRAMFPEAKSIGTLYNPEEQNSLYVQELIKQAAPKAKFSLIQSQIHQPSDVGPAIESLANRVDVVYSANDNTFNSSIKSAVSVTKKLQKPLILGDLSTLESGALAAIGLDYYKMGNELGDIVGKILKGEDISNIPPSGPPNAFFWINSQTAKEINLSLSENILKQANKIIK